MKKIFIFISALYSVNCMAQTITSSQQAVIDAENSFAGLSKSTNTVNAFKAYLSDNTVMFENHKPVIGKKLWWDRKPDSSLLFWWPVFVGVSADGTLGFSTGPWEWSKDRHSEAEGFGYYATIWKKDEQGSWKMGVDLGISLPPSQKTNPPLTTSPIGKPVAGVRATVEKELFSLDNSYNSRLNAAGVSYIAEQFTSDGHLLHSGHKVITQPSEFKSLEESNLKFSFSTAGGGVAGSNDLGYTYGSVTIESTKDDKQTSEERAYLRAWKRDGKEWKIVLDVISR